MAILRRLRLAGRRPLCGQPGGGLPVPGATTAAILAALVAATSLATLQLRAWERAPFAGLPGFVAERLGRPGDTEPTAAPTRAPLPLADAGSLATWREFEHGASRRTAWGHETVAVEAGRPERYLTVSHRLGVRTWRFRLAAHRVGARPPALPSPRILDEAGRNVTPSGLRWTVERRGARWLALLRLDDRSLPVPYVIEPAAHAPPAGLR